MPPPPLATPDEEPRKKGRAAAAGRYHSLISRVSEAEHAAFCASAASSGVKPGAFTGSVLPFWREALGAQGCACGKSQSSTSPAR